MGAIHLNAATGDAGASRALAALRASLCVRLANSSCITAAARAAIRASVAGHACPMLASVHCPVTAKAQKPTSANAAMRAPIRRRPTVCTAVATVAALQTAR